MEPNTLPQEIAEAALRPQSTSVDGLTINERSLADQIAADKYLESKRVAAAGPASALGFLVINPPRTA